MSQILSADGVTPLRQTSTYTAGGRGFGGQMGDWNPRKMSQDAALLPVLSKANARADDLVRNHATAANAIQLHQDQIVGHLFRLSYKPMWRRLGISEEDARAMARDVQDAWFEYAEDPHGCIDVEGHRTFTEMIREVVAVHAGQGEAMIQPVWREDGGHHLFKTQFAMVSPRSISNPKKARDTELVRAGVALDKNGRAVGYWVEEDSYPNGKPAWRFIPRELENGRMSFIHIFEKKDARQTRGANLFMQTLERMKMLDTLQSTWLQNAVVGAMYAATIESELGSEQAMEFIVGGKKSDQYQNFLQWCGEYIEYYDKAAVKLGGAKIPHLMPGDKLNLQRPGNADNGMTQLEESILRYVAAGTKTEYSALSRDYSKGAYSALRASSNDNWRQVMGGRKFIAGKAASMMFGCWLEEAIVRRVITLPRRARLNFYEARHAWCYSEWIGMGRMAIDGLKEAKEAILLIEAGLSTYERELAKLGEDYEEIFAQQYREAKERKEKGLPPPSWYTAQNIAPEEQQGNSNDT